MSKLNCPCGNQLSDVGYPCHLRGTIITQTEEVDAEDSSEAVEAIRAGREVWECDHCGRLAVSYPTKHDGSVKWFAPEDGKYLRLLDYPWRSPTTSESKS